MTAMITLYELAARDDTRFSPFSWRTRWGLAHKGLEFSSVQIGFPCIGELGGNNGTVTAIRMGDTFVEDSWIHPTMVRLVSREVVDRMDPYDWGYFRRTREAMLGCTLEEAQAARDQTCWRSARAIHPIRLTLGKQAWLSDVSPGHAD